MPEQSAAASSFTVPNSCQGALLLLDRTIVLDGETNMGSWKTWFTRGTKLLRLESNDSESEATVLQVRDRAQRALDIMAASGAGAYRTAHPSDFGLYWKPSSTGPQVTVHGQIRLPFPGHMQIFHTTRPDTPAGNQPQALWSPAFRFFRLAQTSKDDFSAFYYTFRAVENLLSAMTPRLLEPRLELERVWLQRALHAFDAQRPKIGEKTWLAGTNLDNFIDAVYRPIRHPVIHAKEGETYLLPLRPEDDAAVQSALPNLTALFLELAADVLKWPLNQRPHTEHAMSKDMIAVVQASLCLFHDDEPTPDGKVVRHVLRVEGNPHGEANSLVQKQEFPRAVLEEFPVIDGWIAMVEGRILAVGAFPLRVVTSGLDSLTLVVTIGLAGDASPFIRTTFD